MTTTTCIILAAGEGTRMKSNLPKVLHPICGKPMIDYIIDSVRSVGVHKIIIVIGHKSELVKKSLKGVEFIKQDRLLGTGDAVVRTAKLILNDSNIQDILILYGDTPLLRTKTIKNILNTHRTHNASCTLLTAQLKNPTGYGRIKRSSNNNIVKIIEELDASIYDKVIEEINVGVYCFNKTVLFEALKKIIPENEKKEYYLTDTIEVIARSGRKIASLLLDDPDEFLGVNTRVELSQAERIIRKRILNTIMQSGVTIVDPENTYVEEEVRIGKDTIIYPYTFIENNVKIGISCSIGPFARVRSGSSIKDRSSIGNFVEIVRSEIGEDTKIRHHSYIGDTHVGKNVNIGAGTIVANYDGKNKHKTVIEDNAFIGTGTILIAPVKIGRGAITGAGSVVTKNHDVPCGKTVVGVPAKILKKGNRR